MENRSWFFKNRTDDELRNDIWAIKSQGPPGVGGYPLEWYEDELERRTGSRKGFHDPA